jgi:xanthine dehydrogenase accessory factor
MVLMFDDFLKKSAELVGKGEPFVVATVVRCEPPTSGKPGDKAIVHSDGKLWGWIGGGCAQPVVVKEALKALGEGRGRLVRISPSANDKEEGVVDYTMTCHSGGSLDIYIDPVLPKPQLVILGRSPVARTLAKLAQTTGYGVSVVAESVVAEEFGDARLVESKGYELAALNVASSSFVVVSTQGEDDEEALQQAANSSAEYVAFVASRTKAEKVMQFLRQKGISSEKLVRVRAPAGLNIAAGSPEEIAVSILAEIIQLRGSKMSAPMQKKPAPVLSVLNTEAKDLVCGMMVDTARARYKSQVDQKWFYFCCAGCKQAFDQQPETYTALSK